MSSPSRETLFSTPWFQVVKGGTSSAGHPHYVIDAPDFVVIVALDSQKQLLLVRQFRPAVEAMTLELPAGHVEAGETPEQAARKELIEETGYEADNLVLLGKLSPSTARFTNRMWVFFAEDARPSPNAAGFREAGLDLVLYDRGIPALLREPEFYSAPTCAALFLALAHGRLQDHANRFRKS